MKILVVGSGGREHALCWKLCQEAEVHCAPGNPGISNVAICYPVEAHDHEGIRSLARQLSPDFILVGPENPLVDGLADMLRASGFAVVGPNADGAKLEASKAFAKAFMLRAGVATAESTSCSNVTDALAAAESMVASGKQVVVKASGNALGKGVVVCETLAQAHQAIRQMMEERIFGEAGTTVVIEERLTGREFSLITLCSGQHYWSFPVAQDYKRLSDGDLGPNTGGMGSYSPVPFLSPEILQRTEREIVAPVLAQLSAEGIDYRGVLFSGIMLTESGPKCLEYNVRFGDPETQTLMLRLGDGLAAALLAVAEGRAIPPPDVKDNAAVTVVLANGEYPGAISSRPFLRLPAALPPHAHLFHAGTKLDADHRLIASGGRVLNVSCEADTLALARDACYQLVSSIDFPIAHYRKDIGMSV
jgi:phosphoribosylamine--glycine ligase